MSLARYRFVGREALPPKLTPEDVALHFFLPDELLAEIRRKVDRQYVLAFAVQVAHLRATGTQPATGGTTPPAILKQLCSQLKLPQENIASLRTLYQNKDRTARDHRDKARELLDFKDYGPSTVESLRAALKRQAADAATVDELDAGAKHWLFDSRTVIPGARVVKDLAREAFAHVEALALNTVNKAVDPVAMQEIVRLMFKQSPKPETSVLEWIKTFSGKHMPKNSKEVAAKIAFLKALGVHNWNFDALSRLRLRGFALRVQHRPPTETAKLKTETQCIEIACFLKYTLMELSDELVYRCGRRITDFYRTGREEVRKRTESKLKRCLDTMREARKTALDIAIAAQIRLNKIVQAIDALLAKDDDTIAQAVREVMSSDKENPRIKAALDALSSLDISAAGASKNNKLLKAWNELRATSAVELPKDFDTSFVDNSWLALLEDEDRVAAMRAFEAYTATKIREGLAGGGMWVSHSSDYRSREQVLISQAEWDRDKAAICQALGLELDVEKVLSEQLALLKSGIADVAKALDQGLLTIDGSGSVCLPDIEKELEEKEEKLQRQTQRVLDDHIGTAQIADILMEVDRQTGFSETLLGRKAKDRVELISVYAGLLAAGTEIDAKSAAAMIPGINAASVASGMRLLEHGERLRAASNKIVDYQQRIEIVKTWGNGSRGSADMMALDATKHLFHARQNPRRKTMSAGIYSMKLDGYAIGHDTPIVQNVWQDSPAVESGYEYNVSATAAERQRLEILAVDTHGFSFVGTAVAKHLHFDLCPQLAHFPDRKLLVPQSFDVPEVLDCIVDPKSNPVNLKAIRKGWDAAMRQIASIRQGRVSVAWVVSRNGSMARDNPARRSLFEFGKLLRTIFLADYFSNADFRREIHTLLNRGEAVHSLQRAIYYGRITAERGRRRDELRAISGALTLLTNIVIAWNTSKLQEAVEHLRGTGQAIGPDVLRHIAPIHYGNINFRGTMEFQVERFSEFLLRPQATASRKQA